MLSRPKYFTEVLDGITLDEISKKINYKKSKLEERKEVVKDILNETSFFEEYFDDYYNPCPNSTDVLSEQDSVCLMLERLGSYLLASDEVKEERSENKIQYKFITSKSYFDKKVNREAHYDEVSDNNILDVMLFVRKEANYLKCKQQKIRGCDYVDGEMGDVLLQYQNYIKLANLENKLTKSSRRDKRTARLVSGVNYDMLDVKNAYKGTIDFKNITKNVGEKNLGDINYGDIKIIDTILKLGESTNEINDIFVIMLDIDAALNKMHLTELEQKVIELYRLGLTKQAIADELGISRPYVFQKIAFVEKKLVELLK